LLGLKSELLHPLDLLFLLVLHLFPPVGVLQGQVSQEILLGFLEGELLLVDEVILVLDFEDLVYFGLEGSVTGSHFALHLLYLNQF
jgi:hypothetical protein